MPKPKRRNLPQALKRAVAINSRWVYRKAQRVTTPGLEGVPVLQVIRFFFRGIYNGAITTRASSVAFSFFLAIVPSLIFLFTLIPYVPVKDFQHQLLLLVKGIMPEYAFRTVESTLTEVVTMRSGGMLSFGFLAAIFFSHNGVSSLIDAFNATYHTIETRSFIAQHLVALGLTFLLPIMVVLGIALLFFWQVILNKIFELGLLKMSIVYLILGLSRWGLIVALFFFSISFLYYLAPARREKYRFFSPGALLATVLIIITSLAFSYYVNNFGQYNKFYGSLGSLIAFLIWLYFNAFGLILGFDLNASIRSAKDNQQEQIKTQLG